MIPPIELGKKDFSRTVRGYSTQEVDDHLRFLMEKYTALYHECEALEARVKELESENNLLKNGEDAVRESLLNAQKASGEILENAREKADIIVRSTKRVCDNLIADYEDKREQERKVLIEMKRKMDEFHDKAVDAIERQAATLDRLVVSIDGLDEMIAEDDADIDILLGQVREEVRAENEAYEKKLAEEAAERDRIEREKAEREAELAAQEEAKAKAELEARAKAEVDAAFEKQRLDEEAQKRAIETGAEDEFDDLLSITDNEEPALGEVAAEQEVPSDGTKVFKKVKEEEKTEE